MFPSSVFDPADGETRSIPVLAETVLVGKRVVETGRIRVIKDVETTEETVITPVMAEEYVVERVAVGQYVDAAPPVRYEGETMILSVVAEEVVVQKRLRLVEEIRLTKHRTETDLSQPVTLRRETVRIEHEPLADADGARV